MKAQRKVIFSRISGTRMVQVTNIRTGRYQTYESMGYALRHAQDAKRMACGHRTRAVEVNGLVYV